MFEQMRVNISDQWVETTLGTLVEACIFYRKVRLISPLRRLIWLLRPSPSTVGVVLKLIEDGHLEIELEQFPSGELANDVRLYRTPITDALQTPIQEFYENGVYDVFPELLHGTPIKEVMQREYSQTDRMLEKLQVELVEYWDECGNARLIGELRRLVDKLLLPKIDESYVRYRLIKLQKTIQFAQTGVLQSVVNLMASEAGSAHPEQVSFAPEVETNGLLFPRIASTALGPASLLAAVSFVGFLYDNAESEHLGDIFTSDRFNAAMRNVYAKNIESRTGRRQIDTFQSSVLETKPIREMFDAGELKFYKALRVMEQKELFLKDAIGKPADIGLTQWYFERRTQGFLGGSTSQKLVRFGMFTAPGVALDLFVTGGVGTALGVGLGAFDSLLLDKLTKGGGPVTFVEGPLRSLGEIEDHAD